MKKLCYWALALVVLSACQQQPKQYFTSSPEIDLVKKGNAAYIAHDWATMRSLYSDTAKIADNVWDNSKFMSADDFVKRLAADTMTFASEKIGDDAIYEMVVNDQGEKWVHNWFNLTGTLKNGKQVSSPIHLVCQFVNDKIVFQGAIYNQLPVYLAMQPDSSQVK